MTMYSVPKIQIVSALAKHRHLGMAAKALSLSQPPLTCSLRQLESNHCVGRLQRVWRDGPGRQNGQRRPINGEPIAQTAPSLLAHDRQHLFDRGGRGAKRSQIGVGKVENQQDGGRDRDGAHRQSGDGHDRAPRRQPESAK